MATFVSKDALWSGMETLCSKYDIPFRRALFDLIERLPTTEYPISDIPKPSRDSISNAARPSSATVLSPKGTTRIEAKWEKTRWGYYAWTCRYGNIITHSKVSPENCIENHLKKLKSLGIDTSRFST